MNIIIIIIIIWALRKISTKAQFHLKINCAKKNIEISTVFENSNLRLR
jgi:hypothetical protein